MRVLEHIKFVDNIKLNWTQLCDVVGLLVFALCWLVLTLHQLSKLFVPHSTLPSADLSIIKRDKETSDRVE